MKASEFYEKYWKIRNRAGAIVSPPKLTDVEKEFLDSTINDSTCGGIYFGRRRRNNIQIDLNILREQMNKLPQFLNQDNDQSPPPLPF